MKHKPVQLPWMHATGYRNRMHSLREHKRLAPRSFQNLQMTLDHLIQSFQDGKAGHRSLVFEHPAVMGRLIYSTAREMERRQV